MSEIVKQTLAWGLEVQQIPAPTFNEGKRAVYVRAQFEKLGLTDISVDGVQNVYGRLPGQSATQSVVLSAHTDTVFPAETDLSITQKNGKIFGPGLGDNSLAVAGLFGLVTALKERKITLPGDLWLVANSCEEGLGDLKGMRAVVKRFEGTPLAYLVLEGMAYTRVFYQGIGVRRFLITARTTGGHSWVDYGRPSAIHAIAALITEISAIDLPTEPRTTLNAGVINGGTSINTIAAEASFQLDLRSVDPKQLRKLIRRVKAIVRTHQQEDVKFDVKVIGKRPAGGLALDHPLVLLAQQAIEAQGDTPDLNIGSTDANIPLNFGYPAICVGLTLGGGGHTTGEYIFTEPLERGMEQLIHLVQATYQLAH